MKRAALLAIVALTIGCASHRYENTVKSWMGHDVNDLIVAWGPPTSTYDMPDGRRMYTWSTDRGAVAVPLGTGAVAVRRGCVTTFTVGATGIVQSWRFEGNAC